MTIYSLPIDALNNITIHLCLKDQRNLAVSSKFFHRLLGLNLQLYRNEVLHILNYIRYMHNINIDYSNENNIIVKYCTFREKNSRIKINFNKLIKLNYSYKLQNDSFICEKIQCNYFFRDIRELIAFVYVRILNCNMYSNVLLFSQKYSYYKIY
jgi:hypothetical protein